MADLTPVEVETLQNAGIVRLQSAARMAGLRFKNGNLDKAGIIASLKAFPSVGRATIAALARMGGEIPKRIPAPVSANPSDWSDPDDSPAPTLPAPTPAPVQTVDLSEYAKRKDVHTWLEGYATKADLLGKSAALSSAIAAVDSHLSALAKEIADSRPVQVILNDRPPITIEGKTHKSFPKLVRYLHANRRVILTGSAGTGKSLAATQAAKALEVPFYLQTPFTEAYEYLGHRDAKGEFHDSPTFRAYTQGGLLLVDEADACLPDAFLPGNPIFDGNGFANFGDGQLHKQHPDFFVILNMNTDGNGATMKYSGRNRLDGATLARFGVRIHWEIDASIEEMMAGNQTSWLKAIRAVRALIEARDIADVNATPRHLKTGALLLSDPANTREDVLKDVLYSGALTEIWSDVIRLPDVSNFLRGF